MVVLDAGLRLLIGLLPVLAFLGALILLDSFKLLRISLVARLLLWGVVAALASFAVNRYLAGVPGLDPSTLVRYVAPVIEEVFKAAPLVLLIARRRFGFLVDAAIGGFAVGAGFAAVENIHYLTVLEDRPLLLWIVRGFGTAVMHGSVTAIMAIVSKQVADSRSGLRWWVFAPGLLLAIAVHSLFNHFYLAPNLSTVVVLVLSPAFFVLVFHFSESRTRHWLGTGFDSDAELLELIHAGRVTSSRIGGYLDELKQRFPSTTVADMLCMLRLRLELSIRAKGILLMRQAGFPIEQDPEVEAKFKELRYLENSIGSTGMMAMAPFFHMSDRDLWQFHMVG